MAEPTTQLMEELLRMMDEGQTQSPSVTRRLHSRATTYLRRSRATNGFPAARTSFIFDADEEMTSEAEAE
ncbi:MAG TPA: hypothetical protein PLD20_27405 [Blastocatellia bacterium]|nr:hypothetical protein [Blastocatellia bacterium]HMV87945.1 hypothetical protein [Blastocatellia bacterium]HMX27291.1 hypothetical protein [Blastocatellia bacterium]HMZ21690.1 hypothetical protein [Blastocatellia bacterium]HNG32959.1 hypothetical protein [Blastocatellia bacterium]